jgi:hypothetical protein
MPFTKSQLLPRRIAALDLNPASVARSELSVFHHLEGLCVRCGCHAVCDSDLRRDPADPAWKGYCPNAVLLNALTECWWLRAFI